jgi:hypothetical protein
MKESVNQIKKLSKNESKKRNKKRTSIQPNGIKREMATELNPMIKTASNS